MWKQQAETFAQWLHNDDDDDYDDMLYCLCVYVCDSLQNNVLNWTGFVAVHD